MVARRRESADAGVTVGQVLTAKINSVEGRLGSIESYMKSVADSLVTLVRLEERHEATAKEVARHADQIIDYSKRLEGVEREIPPLKEVRKWVVMVLLGIAALVGVGVFNAAMNYMATSELQKHTVQATKAAEAFPSAAAAAASGAAATGTAAPKP